MAAAEMKPYEKLIDHWQAEGLSLAPGASKRALREFETKHKVVLPADFREYLSYANGMAQVSGHDCDAKGFSFWPLSRITTVSEECKRSKVEIPAVDDIDHYFAFSDYMQWSWAYAICLLPAREGMILQFGVRSPRIIAGSFTEFVDDYIIDSEKLYLPRVPQ
jgi:hypothetical protein